MTQHKRPWYVLQDRETPSDKKLREAAKKVKASFAAPKEDRFRSLGERGTGERIAAPPAPEIADIQLPGARLPQRFESLAEARLHAAAADTAALAEEARQRGRTVSGLEALRNVAIGGFQTLGEVIEPIEKFVGRPLAATAAGLFRPESFIPVPEAPPGTTVGDIEVRQEAARFREERGKEPGVFDIAEIIQEAQPLPSARVRIPGTEFRVQVGVAGAIELLPWLLIPGGTQSRVGLLALEAKALARAKTLTGVQKVAYEASAKLLRAGADGALPLAKIEEGITKAFGVTVQAVKTGRIRVAEQVVKIPRAGEVALKIAGKPRVAGAAGEASNAPRPTGLLGRAVDEHRTQEVLVAAFNDDLAGIAEELRLSTVTQRMADNIKKQSIAAARKSLDARGLPDEFIVWRGGDVSDSPMSVSLSRNTAEFFANRQGGGNRPLHQYRIRKSDVLADIETFDKTGLLESELLVQGDVLQRSRIGAQDVQAATQAIDRGIRPQEVVPRGRVAPTTPLAETARPPTGEALVSGRIPGGARATPLEPRPKPEAQPRAEVADAKLPSGREPGGPGRSVDKPPSDPYDQLISSLTPERESLISRLRAGIPQELYDRNFPLKELERATGVSARKSAQLVPGAVLAGEDIVKRFYEPVIKTIGKDSKFLERFMVLAREGDILNRNPQALLPGGIAGHAPRLRALETLAKEVGPQRMRAIQDAAEKLWKLNDEHVLSEYVKEGLITQAQRTAMLSTHPHYIPFRRADFTELLTQNFGGAAEANVSTTGIQKMGIEGSIRKLDNPLLKLLQEPLKSKTLIFRNRAAKAIVRALEDLQGQTGEELVRYIEPKKQLRIAQRVTGEVVPILKKGETSQDFGTISFFEDGIKNTVEVPAVYANVAKGLEAEPNNILLTVVRAMNAPLRQGATTYNPFFLPVNVMRDAMSAMFREKLFPFGPNYMAGLWAAIRKNATFSEAAQSGALLSGVVENMRPGRALANPLGGITVKNPWEAITVPFRLMEQANIIAERGVRIGVFRKLRAEGLDTLEAAVRTRDATVDFAKSGHAMRVINQIIPFTNAAVQGSANIARTIRDHPVRSLAFATMFSGISITIRVNNMRFETSQLIPDYEYTRNWVIQFGEGVRSDGTKYPVYIKVPKGEIAAIATFPAEAMMHLASQSEDRSVTELFLSQGFEAARTISPIEIGGVTGIIPPILETGVGLQTGVNPFSGAPLIPRGEQGLPPEQQFGERTSTTAVQLGQLFKVSPRLIDFALRDVAAGTGQLVNWLVSMGLEALTGRPEEFGAGAPDAEPRLEGAESLSKIPGVSRFVGTRATQLERRGFSNLDDAVVATNRSFNRLPDVNRLGIRLGSVGNSIRGIDLTPQQRADHQVLLGERAMRLVRLLQEGARYVTATDAVRESAIRGQMDNARGQARLAMLKELRPPARRFPVQPVETQPAGLGTGRRFDVQPAATPVGVP